MSDYVICERHGVRSAATDGTCPACALVTYVQDSAEWLGTVKQLTDAAYARGRSDATRALLEKVRTLPSPVETVRVSAANDTLFCAWCHEVWQEGNGHPVNDCLYALAHASEAVPSPEEGEG